MGPPNIPGITCRTTKRGCGGEEDFSVPRFRLSLEAAVAGPGPEPGPEFPSPMRALLFVSTKPESSDPLEVVENDLLFAKGLIGEGKRVG